MTSSMAMAAARCTVATIALLAVGASADAKGQFLRYMSQQERSSLLDKSADKSADKSTANSSVDRSATLEAGAMRSNSGRILEAGTMAADDAEHQRLGVMNRNGVTRYKSAAIQTVKAEDGAFYWSDPSGEDLSRYKGATDLLENVSWGWHHPNGVYNSIPVGPPLIDDEMSIYLGADDAIRKFTVTGELVWSYGPRGQLAAAPTLIPTIARRAKPKFLGSAEEAATAEEELRPEWAGTKNKETKSAFGAFMQIKAGDRLMVKPGGGYHKDGKEYYKAGDIGEVEKVISGKTGIEKAMVRWPRTGHHSISHLSSFHKKFTRIKDGTTAAGMLVGSTTSGYVFAVDMMTGEELWATQTCEMIHGVKGSVSGKNGVVVAATNRCTDRYCYRYRNQSNPLTPSNSIVRGLSANDGSALWEFKPVSPVWNMVPQYGKFGDTVMFNDYEGTAYCLDLQTGRLKWKYDGHMGTHTQAFALYFAPGDLLYAMGVKNLESYSYASAFCNPFPAPGILPHCGTWPKSPGWFKALNASSGRVQWEYPLAEPPAAAGLGQMHRGFSTGTRLIIVSGHNCKYGSGSKILAVNPQDGEWRWEREGPTLWTDYCAGDKEGADVRRAMGGRAHCEPSSWSMPAMDGYGDLYLGSQVGELQRWGTHDGHHGSRRIELLSTLTTGVAFQDQAIAFAPGLMAVATCTSLIVFQTYALNNATIPYDWDMGPAPRPGPPTDDPFVY